MPPVGFELKSKRTSLAHATAIVNSNAMTSARRFGAVLRRRPGVDERNPGWLEVRDVAGDDGQPVHQRCRRNERITKGSGIRDVEACAAAYDGGIHRQDSSPQLVDGDDRHEELRQWNGSRPCRYVAVRLAGPRLPRRSEGRATAVLGR